MNRLSAYIPDKRISYCKTVGKFDYRKLMNLDCGFDIREDSLIIERYEYYNQNKDKIFNIDDGKYLNQMDCYLPKYVRDKIIEETRYDLDYITNTLVVYFYTIKKSSNKELLWSCFGDIIVENLKKNVKGKICPICGKKARMSADHIGPISLGFTHRGKFNPMCSSCNSKKNNRITLCDVKQLIEDEANGEQVISWHTKPLWDKLKNTIDTEDKALALSKVMRLHLHNVLLILSDIYENGYKEFLKTGHKFYKFVPDSYRPLN